METITLEVGKEYKIIVGPAVGSGGGLSRVPGMPEFEIGDVFDWTETHRTTSGNRTPVGARVVTSVDDDGAIEFIVSATGRRDRTGPKMLNKDCAYIIRNAQKIWQR